MLVVIRKVDCQRRLFYLSSLHGVQSFPMTRGDRCYGQINTSSPLWWLACTDAPLSWRCGVRDAWEETFPGNIYIRLFVCPRWTRSVFFKSFECVWYLMHETGLIQELIFELHDMEAPSHQAPLEIAQRHHLFERVVICAHS